MKHWHFLGIAALLAVSACNGGGGGGEADPNSVEVVSFQGGYGIDFFEEAGTELAEKEGWEVDVSGGPRVWEQLRGRFNAGDPPDVTWPGWGMDYWGLAYDGQLMDMNEALDGPAWGGEGTWRDSFDPQLLAIGAFEGKQYMLPYHANLGGWWYNKTLFNENGWTPPANFEELLVLNDKIKAKGIAPITHQGQYPYYALYGFLFPWLISSGGDEAWRACQNLEPGAWNSPHVLKAAQMVETLAKRGDFQSGSIGMSHTDSQTEMINGRAAMIPCGSWFISEMEPVLKDHPQGLAAHEQVEFMLPPIIEGGSGDPTAIMVAVEPWVIPADAKNPQRGIDYFKYLTSPEKAKQFIEEKGTVMAIKGVEGAKYPPHLEIPATLFDDSTYKWNTEFRLWYKEFAEELEGAMSSLIDGNLTAEEFVERVEREAESVRNDETITKRSVE